MEMTDVAKVGRVIFALGLFCFGVENFVFGHFVAGRAPQWPEGVSGEGAWSSVTGALFLFAGLMILQQRKVRLMSIIIGVILLVWAVLRYIPILAANFQWGGELTSAGKALTLFGGAFAAAGYASPQGTSSSAVSGFFNSTTGFVYVGRICFGTFLIICGIEHFLFIQFVATLVPSWMPAPFFWSYFTGVALVAGGVGLLFDRTVQLAALLTGIMIFLWFLMVHLPRGFSMMNENEWIAVCEAFTFSGIAFMLVAPVDRD